MSAYHDNNHYIAMGLLLIYFKLVHASLGPVQHATDDWEGQK